MIHGADTARCGKASVKTFQRIGAHRSCMVLQVAIERGPIMQPVAHDETDPSRLRRWLQQPLPLCVDKTGKRKHCGDVIFQPHHPGRQDVGVNLQADFVNHHRRFGCHAGASVAPQHGDTIG